MTTDSTGVPPLPQVFPPDPAADAAKVEAAELRTCVRDLISLLALPALWRERTPREIFSSLLEALEATLPIDFARVEFTSDPVALELLRVGGREIDQRGSPWHDVAVAYTAAPPDATDVATPAGPMRATRVALGYHGARGSIVFASRKTSFPTTTDAVVLRAAASLADTGLETARLLEQREQAVRAKDEFLAMLGHELRNPLAPIATAMQLLRHRLPPPAPRELDIIDRQSQHLLRLVDDLLDVARITRGKVELRREPTEANQVLGKALETASPWLDRAGHQLRVDVEPHIILDVDPTRISQVLANLLTNAAKYTPAGGLISVSIARRREEAVISVTDNGVGIAAELQPRIFDMFVQGGRLGEASRTGLGIGLALVKSLVAMHGGRVGVVSAGAGQGSTFTVTLPLAGDADSASLRQTGDPDADLSGCRILLVDDNVDAASMMADALRVRGAAVTVSHDSVTALETAAQLRPHVALLDIGLPVMDGHELGLAIRRRLGAAAPRIFALTGYGQESDRARSAVAGFAGHLVKPVDVTVLAQTIRSALRP